MAEDNLAPTTRRDGDLPKNTLNTYKSFFRRNSEIDIFRFCWRWNGVSVNEPNEIGKRLGKSGGSSALRVARKKEMKLCHQKFYFKKLLT